MTLTQFVKAHTYQLDHQTWCFILSDLSVLVRKIVHRFPVSKVEYESPDLDTQVVRVYFDNEASGEILEFERSLVPHLEYASKAPIKKLYIRSNRTWNTLLEVV